MCESHISRCLGEDRLPREWRCLPDADHMHWWEVRGAIGYTWRRLPEQATQRLLRDPCRWTVPSFKWSCLTAWQTEHSPLALLAFCDKCQVWGCGIMKCSKDHDTDSVCHRTVFDWMNATWILYTHKFRLVCTWQLTTSVTIYSLTN